MVGWFTNNIRAAGEKLKIQFCFSREFCGSFRCVSWPKSLHFIYMPEIFVARESPIFTENFDTKHGWLSIIKLQLLRGKNSTTCSKKIAQYTSYDDWYHGLLWVYSSLFYKIFKSKKQARKIASKLVVVERKVQ